MIDWLSKLISQAETVVVAFVMLMAIGMILVTWAKTRSFVRTLGAAIASLFLIWVVNNIDLLKVPTSANIVDPSGDRDPATGAGDG